MRSDIATLTTIRIAEKNDVSALAQLAVETYTDAFGDSMAASDLAAYLETNFSDSRIEAFIVEDVVLVAEFEGRMVGFVHFGDINMPVETTADKSKELRKLYVHRDFQNKGIGSALMDAALEHPLLQAAEYVYLDVWEQNAGAQRLYQRYGFEVIGRRRFVLPSGAEADFDYIMVRRASKKPG